MGNPRANMPPRMGAWQPGRLLHGLGYRREDGPKKSELRSDAQSRSLMPLFIGLICVAGAYGQGNYEVQGYGSDLVAKGVTMVELHSNFTASGTKGVVDGVLPT